MRTARNAEIRYHDRASGALAVETVHQGELIDWLYNTRTGALVRVLAAGFPGYSQACGLAKGSRRSARKIAAFAAKYRIDLADFLPEEGRGEADPYGSFNAFFARRFRPGRRVFCAEGREMPAFCEARYLGWERFPDGLGLPVKGRLWTAGQLLARDDRLEAFRDGPLLIARLSPMDYHRFHFPDDGATLEHYRVPGGYDSVNPLALARKPDILARNERRVTILATRHFGTLAYVEVGAMSVGRIVQTHGGGPFARGEEKGCFLYGGSTVVVLGERGRWRPSPDIAGNSAQGLETLVRLGEPVSYAV